MIYLFSKKASIDSDLIRFLGDVSLKKLHKDNSLKRGIFSIVFYSFICNNEFVILLVQVLFYRFKNLYKLKQKG